MMDPAARAASSPWPKLPADALLEIAGRLHDAGDFVRFRSACRPWHEALLPSRAPSFLPWIVEAYDASADNPRVLLRSPFSPRKTRHILPLAAAIPGMSIQGSHASGGRVLGVGYPSEGRTAALVNPLDVGDANTLPPVPQSKSRGDKWRSASGAVVSSSGAVVFHTLRHEHFAAIQLQPGEPAAVWEEVAVPCPVAWDERWQDENERRAASLWSSALLPAAAGGCGVAAPALPPMPRGGSNRYLLEFRGELLCVDVVSGESSVSVRVHATRPGDEGWRRRGGAGGHLCFFLGPRSSFTVDALEFAGSAEVAGGCAYFFLRHPERTERALLRDIGVYRYSFQSGTATVVGELHSLVIPIWFMPRPRMSPLPPRAQ
ncbi:unnamed protein product [Urochloa humidicola]